MMMDDEELSTLERSNNEMKRIDHLIYVSLKYTRTVDVIRNIVERMLNTFDIVFEAFLKVAEKEGRIFEIPAAPALRAAELRKLYKEDAELMKYLDFYLLLRQFKNAEYSATQEFRRHVAMNARFANGEEKILNIDIITEYYETMKSFMKYATDKITNHS